MPRPPARGSMSRSWRPSWRPKRWPSTRGLREAVASQILVSKLTAEDHQYSFRHALVQEAIYADLLPGERTRLHAAFAHALSNQTQPDGDLSRTAELAYHWHAAHDLPQAFEASVRAGLAADAMFGSADALANYERALELWDRVPDAAARSPVDRVRDPRCSRRRTRGTHSIPCRRICASRGGSGRPSGRPSPGGAGAFVPRRRCSSILTMEAASPPFGKPSTSSRQIPHRRLVPGCLSHSAECWRRSTVTRSRWPCCRRARRGASGRQATIRAESPRSHGARHRHTSSDRACCHRATG